MKTRETKQSKLILKLIRSACFHPSAEQIYKLAKKKEEKISMGTIYRNLDKLISQNLIKKIDIENEASRFDILNDNKAYFISSKTSSIYDLDLNKKDLEKIFKKNSIIKNINKMNIIIFGEENESKSKIYRRGKIKNNLKIC